MCPVMQGLIYGRAHGLAVYSMQLSPRYFTAIRSLAQFGIKNNQFCMRRAAESFFSKELYHFAIISLSALFGRFLVASLPFFSDASRTNIYNVNLAINVP